ncbi:hypothetical protein HPB49_015317 [Dermacentor silvarum]|uniref:Uncharacterized protein n=1 Tax=Dermacentor silvarum TaxID=543639 RepID=A0ACB8CXR3_DERSI|nr:hypothetical protein HPB49_015317 [Dermacentor silvarum]
MAAVSVSVSVWTLVSISLERFFAIVRPLQSRRWQTISHAYRVIAVVWALSLVHVAPIAVLSQLIPTRTAESTQFAVIDRVLGFLCAIAPDVIYFGMDKEALAREFENVNRYHILGDAAYPIREHLLTPFKNYGNMTQAKSKYNTCHASTRVVIENAFALLKQRFRQLRYIEFTTVDKITQFIVGCCVLHNICLDNGDIDVEDLLTDEEREERSQDTLLRIRQDRAELAANRQPQTDRESVLRRLGELKRNALVGQL